MADDKMIIGVHVATTSDDKGIADATRGVAKLEEAEQRRAEKAAKRQAEQSRLMEQARKEMADIARAEYLAEVAADMRAKKQAELARAARQDAEAAKRLPKELSEEYLRSLPAMERYYKELSVLQRQRYFNLQENRGRPEVQAAIMAEFEREKAALDKNLKEWQKAEKEKQVAVAKTAAETKKSFDASTREAVSYGNRLRAALEPALGRFGAVTAAIAATAGAHKEAAEAAGVHASGLRAIGTAMVAMGFGLTQLVFAGISKLTSYIRDATAAALHNEQVMMKLQRSMDAFNQNVEVTTESVRHWAEAMRGVAHVSASAAIELVNRLIPATKDATSAMYLAEIAARAAKLGFGDASTVADRLAGVLYGRKMAGGGTDAFAKLIMEATRQGKSFGQILRELVKYLDDAEGGVKSYTQRLAEQAAKQEEIAEKAGKTFAAFKIAVMPFFTAIASILSYTVAGLKDLYAFFVGFLRMMLAFGASITVLLTKGPAEAAKTFHFLMGEMTKDLKETFYEGGEAFEDMLDAMGIKAKEIPKIVRSAAEEAAIQADLTARANYTRLAKRQDQYLVASARREKRAADEARQLAEANLAAEETDAGKRLELQAAVEAAILQQKLAAEKVAAAEMKKAMREQGGYELPVIEPGKTATAHAPAGEAQSEEEQRLASDLSEALQAIESNYQENIIESRKKFNDKIAEDDKKAEEKRTEVLIKAGQSESERFEMLVVARAEEEYELEQDNADRKAQLYDKAAQRRKELLNMQIADVRAAAKAEQDAVEVVNGDVARQLEVRQAIGAAAQNKIDSMKAAAEAAERARKAAFTQWELANEKKKLSALQEIDDARTADANAMAMELEARMQLGGMTLEEEDLINRVANNLELERLKREEVILTLQKEAAIREADATSTTEEEKLRRKGEAETKFNALLSANQGRQKAMSLSNDKLDQDLQMRKLRRTRDTINQAGQLAMQAFGESKEVQAALTLVNTYTAAMETYKAYAASPPLAAAMAALTIAAGLKQVQNIYKTKPGDTGGGSGGGPEISSSVTGAASRGGFQVGSGAFGSGQETGVRLGYGGWSQDPYGRHAANSVSTVDNSVNTSQGDTVIVNQHLLSGAQAAQASREVARVLLPGERAYNRTRLGRYRATVGA